MVVTTQLMRYFILCSLTLFLQCFAMPNTELNIEDSNKDLSSYRQQDQLYSSDDYLSSSNSNSPNINLVIVFFGTIVFIIIYLLIRCCKEYESQNYSDTILHPPHPGQRPRQTVQTRRLVPAPPRTRSTGLILPTDGNQDSIAIIGIINPNYIPPANQTPSYTSQEVSDAPPAYDAVVKNGQTQYPKVVETPPKY